MSIKNLSPRVGNFVVERILLSQSAMRLPRSTGMCSMLRALRAPRHDKFQLLTVSRIFSCDGCVYDFWCRLLARKEIRTAEQRTMRKFIQFTCSSGVVCHEYQKNKLFYLSEKTSAFRTTSTNSRMLADDLMERRSKWRYCRGMSFDTTNTK